MHPILTIAACLMIEAEGQGEAGMRDVASVAWYRGDGVPEKIAAAILETREGRIWQRRMPEKVQAMIADDDKLKNAFRRKAWFMAVTIASEICRGVFKPTIKADGFFANDGKKRDMHGRVVVTTRYGHVYWRAQ